MEQHDPPLGLCMGSGKSPLFYISELGPGLAVIRNVPNFGPRITITDGDGAVVARLGMKPAGTQRGAFIAPHRIPVDSPRDIYVGEVGFGPWPTLFPGGAPPPSPKGSPT